MRILFLLLCALYLTQASEHLSQENIKFSILKDTLQITLPPKVKFTSQQSKHTITLTLDQQWLDKPLKKSLNYPFQSIQITPKQNQTILTIQTQSDFSYEESRDAQNLHLIFKSISNDFWWKYGMMIGILLTLILFLFYIKKRQTLPASHRFKMTQLPIGKDCKIIILHHQEKTFTIFSDGRGCVLLDTKDEDCPSKGD